MTTGATGQLGLALPVQGELSGTWGDTVNNGITQYTNIAIAGTLTLTNDGAVTLANTTGDASASNITSTLTGAGTVTAQFAIVRVTGTLTTAKVVTGPSYSKTYTVVNAATGGIVTFKASGQTGVSIAVGETAFVYYNGTDYVKVVGTATAGAAGGSNTQVQFNSSGVLAGSSNMTFDGTTLTANALTVTNAVTLSGGTANGVAYLNGSKVVTSGSALTFDGTNFGIGLTAGVPLDVGGAIRSKISGGSPIYYFNDGTYQLDLKQSGNALVFDLNGGSEQMRLTSTGLGIGTSSPVSKLHVVGEARVYTGNNLGYWGVDGGNSYVYFGTNSSGYSLSFQTGGSDRMRLDASGNLGLGVTPSAWVGYKVLQAGIGSFIGGSSGAYLLQDNAYTDNSGAGWKYINSSYAAAQYYAASGAHVWRTAPSGTAGNAITFTQAMTLDASGNLAVGTTNTTYGKVNIKATGSQIYSGLTAFSNDGTESFIGLGCTSSVAGISVTYGATGSYLPFVISTGGSERVRIDSSGNVGIGKTPTDKQLEIYGSSSPALRIQNSTTGTGSNDGLLLEMSGSNINFFNYEAGAMIFGTSATERARISSGGALSIGTTSATGNRLNVVGGSSLTYWEGGNNSTNITSGSPDQALCKFSDNTVGNFWQTRFVNNGGNTMFSMGAQSTSHSATFNNGKFFVDGGVRATPETFIVDTTNEYSYFGYSSSNGAYRIQVNGQIFATSSTIATSDGRYKENVQDLTGALDLVKALRPVSFNWKKHNIHVFNTEDTTVGFIAQEVQQAMADKPYLNSFVKLNKCTSFDEVEQKYSDEEFLGFAETNMVAILTKALQELNAKFDAYVASHP